MTDQLSKINKLVNIAETKDVNLFFINRKKNQSTKDIDYSIQIGSIQNEIGREFLEIVEKQITSITKDQFEITKYLENDDIGCSDCPIIETILQKDVPNLDNILSLLSRTNELINPKKFEGCWGYIVKIYTKENTLFLFKKVHQKKNIHNGFWGTIISSGIFTKIENSLFFIDTYFDAALLLKNVFASNDSENNKDSEVLIFNRNNFERIFDFYDYYKKYVAGNVQQLSSLINDTDFLLECCNGDVRKLKKIMRVLKNSSYSSLNSKNIQEICKNYDLNININNDGKIVFEKDKVWSIIRILNEDYLKSEISGNRFISRAKVKQGTN